jgi:hypothetical protein
MATLAASGGSGTGYTWSLSSGTLPAGFSLSSAGVLSSTGSPLATEGSYSFWAEVTDSAGNTATQLYTLEISCRAGVFVSASDQYMQATFIAPGGSTLADYATACGFGSFNWQQQITTLPGPSPFTPNESFLINSQNLASDGSLMATPTTPFSDLPQGGYTYLPTGYDPYPFYYPSSGFTPGGSCTIQSEGIGGCLSFPYVVSADDTTLSMIDDPSDLDLLPGEIMAFSSALVGVDGQGNAHTLYSWTWNSTFNGTAGGVAQTASIYAIDPGSGTGGVTLTSINGVPFPFNVPTVTVTPSSTNLTAAQPLTVTVTVSGGTGSPTPTGSVTLTCGTYTSVATTLSGGSATITIPAGSLVDCPGDIVTGGPNSALGVGVVPTKWLC